MRLLITVFTLSQFITAHAQNQKQPDFSTARSIIQDRIDNHHLPSASIAVVKGGKIIWEEGFGYADKETKRKATPHTPYCLASVSKTMTATAIMKLAEQKKLNLDSPINKYLGNARVSSPRFNPKEATVRRVMSHSSGITTFNSWCRGDSSECARADDEYISRYAIMVAPPGRLDYSNLGYGLLDRVIRNVSGMSYPDYMRSAVFQPLGMKNSFVATDLTNADRAMRYAGNESEVRVEYPFSHQYQAGGSSIYSSAHDLALFAMLHLKDLKKKAIISEQSIMAMQETVATDESSQYGLGWWIDSNYHGYKGFLAQGGSWCAQAWVQLIPSEDIAVIVVANVGHGKPWRAVINEVMSQLLPTFRENMVAAASAKAPVASPPTHEPPNGKWKGFISTYKGDVPLTFDFNGSASSTAALGDVMDIKLPKVRLSAGWYAFTIEGDLGLEDTGRGPYNLNIYLTEEGDLLYGSAQTSGSEHPDTPQLSYWVEMRKQ